MSPLAAVEASTSSFLTYLLAGALLFSFGFARAVWLRAKKDYKSTKAAVKPLRKAMWGAIFRTFKIGLVVVLLAVALAAWVRSDAGKGEAETTTPAKLPSPAGSR